MFYLFLTVCQKLVLHHSNGRCQINIVKLSNIFYERSSIIIVEDYPPVCVCVCVCVCVNMIAQKIMNQLPTFPLGRINKYLGRV